VAEKSISVTNIVNGTTRLQPVVLQIGQAAGVMAALSIKEDISPAELEVRKVQSQLLEAGGYLLPYLDVPKDHPRFKVYQRIGATGILKGTGMNVGWENQTWFFPERSLSQSDMDQALQQLQYFKNIPAPESLQYNHIMNWFKKLNALVFPGEAPTDWLADTKALSVFLGAKVSSNDLISRGDFALILDELMDPFYRMPVNLYGAFDSDDQYNCNSFMGKINAN